MNQRQRFIRKIVYACAIVALLLPLSFLSQPATTESSGGMLAQMREENHLSQNTLGEIDPASETIKLATLGMRGVAANVLWAKAHEYRKHEDWVNLSATLEQIARLQPNFVSVWVYQGWNLSYNISVEFDDYRDRYFWVIKGINFLEEGATYNTQEPRLNYEIGWTIGHKIGRADEHLLFRKLFRDDDEFHGPRVRTQRDNWLVGREYLLEAQSWVDNEGVPLKGKSPLLFNTHPVMCLINHAEAVEEEGTFGEVAKEAWRKASDAWEQLSNRDLPTQYNLSIRLADKELFDKRAEEAREALDKLTPPGVYEQIFEEHLATLTEEEREAYDTPAEQRTNVQGSLMFYVEQKLDIPHLEVADRITGEDHAAALKAAEDATAAEFVARAIDGERGIINYDYWRRRCQIEPQDTTLEARKKMYDADQSLTSADFLTALDLYNDGLNKWREVLDANDFLVEDANLTEELAYSVSNYVRLMRQLDLTLPEPFILQDVLDANERFTGQPYPGSRPKTPEDAGSTDPSAPAPEPGEQPPAPTEPEGELPSQAQP